MDRKTAEAFASIPQKANIILYVVLIGFLVISARLWHVTVVQHDVRASEAFRSRRHVVIESAMRGTIRDRFNIVLAANAIDYRVGVRWAQIGEIPKKYQQKPLRKEYVQAFARKVGFLIGLPPQRIEDVIYSYAVFSPTTPVILKSGLTENEYYRLNLLAKDWPGLVVERATRRVYPREKSCCHVVGYTASVGRKEYEKALSDLRALKVYVEAIERGEDVDGPEGIQSYVDAKAKLVLLERKVYSLNDENGKMGVEAAFEPQLRGYSGKKIFVTNAHGDVLREAVGSKDPISGQRLVLSISTELQEWCERLLAVSEEDRFVALEHDADRLAQGAKNPLLRGGAIIAMEPHSGELVACASFPRFDPNDFVKATKSLFATNQHDDIHRWIENDTYVGKVWDGVWPAVREHISDHGSWEEREEYLTLDLFAKTIVPTHSPLLEQFSSRMSVRSALLLQENIRGLSAARGISKLEVIEENPPSLQKWFKSLSSRERVLLYDLTRAVIRCEEIPEKCLAAISSLSLEEFRQITSAKICLLEQVREPLQKAFQEGLFQEWRRRNEAAFLKEKRALEAAEKTAAHPFLQYLDREQARQFSLWWKENKERIVLEMVRSADHLILAKVLKVLPADTKLAFLSALKGYSELTDPLVGSYGPSGRVGAVKTTQDLIKLFLTMQSAPLSSFCHMQPSAPGSLFKLVVALSALRQQLEQLKGDESRLSPSLFSLTDSPFKDRAKQYLGVDAKGNGIPQLYKGGRLPRSVTAHIGSIDLVGALKHSSNPYFALLAGEFLDSPQRLLSEASALGYGQKTGIALPFEAAGRLPQDLATNRTGLYTTAIGQHTLLATPIQSTVMLSALATGQVVVPKIVNLTIGPSCAPHALLGSAVGPYDGMMRRVGMVSPVWLGVSSEVSRHHIHIMKPRIRHTLPLPKKVQAILFEGMKEAFEHAIHNTQSIRHRKEMLSSLRAMQHSMIGKSSTAESYERLGINIGQRPFLYNHTWYGSIFFENDRPNLVVLIFLRYGTFGKEAAPIAASVAAKWKEICHRHALQTL